MNIFAAERHQVRVWGQMRASMTGLGNTQTHESVNAFAVHSQADFWFSGEAVKLAVLYSVVE